MWSYFKKKKIGISEVHRGNLPCGPDFGDTVKVVNLASPLSFIGQAGINSQ